uniref:acid phosphatase n=1 Tax=Timema bartmani TaxID=61472 RepID=A0A7R9F0U4_9NEOP|nr:unnamed protein product [Timema bartmani]
MNLVLSCSTALLLICQYPCQPPWYEPFHQPSYGFLVDFQNRTRHYRSSPWCTFAAQRWTLPILRVDTGDDLGTIIFSSVIFRHGDRTILGSYRNDPYNNQTKYWPRGYEQLTEIGEDQHFKQGSFFRKRYNPILPEIYNVNDLYVRSTNIDRALASAQAHLAGLYPPTEQNLAQPNIKFQVIPIHTTAPLNDKELYGLPLPKWTKPYYPQPLENLFLFEKFITSSAIKKLQRLLRETHKAIIPDDLTTEGTELLTSSFLQVSYKNSTETDPHLLQLPGCDALCPLDSFVELTKPIIPDDLTTECAEEVVAGQEYHFEIPAAGKIAPKLL